MVEPISQLRDTLKASHQSLTRSRQIVFDVLFARAPLSMSELVAACHNAIDRASVYRTVALFEHLGIVQRLPMGWKFKLELTDNFTAHHHHLTCLGCGKIIDIREDAALEQRLERLAETHGFAPQSHQLEIRGLCVDCQTRQRPSQQETLVKRS